MNEHELGTVGDLIAALSGYDPHTPLRIAVQPNYPMAHHLAQVVSTPTAAHGILPQDAMSGVVWLGTGEQVGYLPGLAARALGWSE
ncbi:hypothetical protein [Lentzea sp. HUAS12]|uniref:hypothetical protein n=1 Tax=Lentzea sp. HUAS12 TaxID=2951806 RepID=UPI0020A1A51C|nr:hypothetical protein [Lentzea sp. HUAS12]USX56421.1 hypothetical protein ND450_20660 [Lentzea sp. HUAS12]